MVRINWLDTGFIVGYHVLLLVSLPYLFLNPPSGGMWAALITLAILTGLGITVLYHRCYSHAAFTMNKSVEAVMLFFATLSAQGSALQWCYEHRIHHAYVDKERDPYNIKKGFWHAHVLWLFRKRAPIEFNVIPDLKANRLLVFQHKFYGALFIMYTIVTITTFGFLFGDMIGAFIVLFLLRLFFTHHTTWFINSLAHTLGTQPFSKEHTAVNNWILSFVTYGEGYHNFHHTFPSDYRNGIRWWQFDMSKYVIWTLSRLGLAKGLRRVDHPAITKKIVLEDYRVVLPRVKSAYLRKEFDARLQQLHARLDEVHAALRQYRELRAQRQKLAAKAVRRNIRAMKKALRVDLRAWSRLCAAC